MSVQCCGSLHYGLARVVRVCSVISNRVLFDTLLMENKIDIAQQQISESSQDITFSLDNVFAIHICYNISNSDYRCSAPLKVNLI